MNQDAGADAGPPRRVAVLGSTGSIGLNTLDVISRHPGRFRVVALSAHRQVERLWEQIRELGPLFAVVSDDAAGKWLAERVRAEDLHTRILVGDEGLEVVAAADETDVVMAAIVGAAGLRSTFAAVRAGKRVLLANKEALVMAGGLIMDAAAISGAELLPIDSEHNAVFQCLPGGCGGTEGNGVDRIVLTASGGPFLRLAGAALQSVTPDEACSHPNWSMGRKISVDSATLMNKGLEVIEACWLFGVSADDIEVVVHPQSVIHSLVQYADGSTLAQLGHPDMRTPIAHALGWPERIDSGVARLDMTTLGSLDFETPDTDRFPALAIAGAVARTGGVAGAVLNAANEIAVAHFLERRLSFPDIAEVSRAALADMDTAMAPESIEHLLEIDGEARRVASAHAGRAAS